MKMKQVSVMGYESCKVQGTSYKTKRACHFLATCTLQLVTLLFLLPSIAHAACSDPAGNEGDMVYNSSYDVMMFCNGSDQWISMAGGGSGGGGSSVWLNDGPGGPAEIYYNGGNVGVGTNNPAHKLHVVGNVHATGNITCDGTCGGEGIGSVTFHTPGTSDTNLGAKKFCAISTYYPGDAYMDMTYQRCTTWVSSGTWYARRGSYSTCTIVCFN